ncbi:MAG: EcsC family protein, partial [Acidobacteria bacterium]
TVVAEKIVAQGVPVIGAVGGAAINVAFVRHFQAMARGHFVVRRLERSYGEAIIRENYGKIARGERLPTENRS